VVAALCFRLIGILYLNAFEDINRYAPETVIYRTVIRWPTTLFHARLISVSELKNNSSKIDSSKAAGRTILVVDDEPDVLRLLQSILTEDGYEVIAARSADSAIKAFAGLSRRPDLLLVDVVMPGMSGPMLVENLRKNELDLKVLFMSGYDDRHVVQRYVVDKGFHLISKPFTVKSLRKAMEEAIRSPEPARRVEPAR
jgi:CheY-like chemotaxis protein